MAFFVVMKTNEEKESIEIKISTIGKTYFNDDEWVEVVIVLGPSTKPRQMAGDIPECEFKP
jgi:hypothetical protein